MFVGESYQSPIGIFWDIENCRVPKNKSATDLVLKIRKNIVHPNGYREFEFFCGCDTTTLTKQICEELNLAGVTIAHVPSSSKNAADEKIKEQMLKFVDTYSSRAIVMLISGDVNFAPTLRGFRDRIGAKVLLMHSHAVAQELKNCANKLFNFNQFCEDLQPRQISLENNPVYIRVDKLPKDMTLLSILGELELLAKNRGGKVEHLNPEFAFIKFPCKRDAERALGGINGNKIGNSVVSAGITNVAANFQNEVNSKKNKMTQGNLTADPFNMMQLNNVLLPQPNMASGCVQKSTNTYSFMKYDINGFPSIVTFQQPFYSCDNKHQQQASISPVNLTTQNHTNIVSENVKTYRLIVSGVSGKLPEHEVRERLLCVLRKKPKSVIVSNGSVDMEFKKLSAMEEAFTILNGINFDGFPLIATKALKPRTISNVHKQNSIAASNVVTQNPINYSSENSKTFRIVVCGFSGNLPEKDVRLSLLSFLTKKPKTIIVSNGNANMEFQNSTAMEEAFHIFNGMNFHGFPLSANKIVKPRNNSNDLKQQISTAIAKVHVQMASSGSNEDSKSYRLTIGGISGNLPKEAVRVLLLKYLKKKPKSAVVSNGNAVMEFHNLTALEKAFNQFNGMTFLGSKLIANKLIKQRNN